MPVKTAKITDFSKQREIAAGGEGKIYEHPSDKNKVVKIYHQARKPDFVKHLEKLTKLNNSGMFVAPKDIFVDNSGKCIGFDMDYVDFNNYFLFNNLFNKGFCNTHGITIQIKHHLLKILAGCLEDLHKLGIVIGDLNQYNLFFTRQGKILFVDVDSYATNNQPHSGVLLDDIRDWTTTDINDKTDIWAYDILAFWSTTYCHPYKWVVPGNKESLEVRVKANKSILTPIKDIKIPALYEAPQGDVLKQFTEIFSGRRYLVSFTGTYTPVSTVVKQQITSQSLSIEEINTNVTNINVCENYYAVKTATGWLLVDASFKGRVRSKSITQCDELYPANNGNFVYRIKDKIFSGDGKTFSQEFYQPVFMYNNGYLCAIEYPLDTQWNFDIHNQLGGLDNTMTKVFAKSIVKRQSLIQNFGSQKYMNVPLRNKYTMFTVPNGTKDGIYANGYYSIEYKNKSQVKFEVRNVYNTDTIDFDYLPHIAVKPNGNKFFVFVPENGYIDVYQDGHILTKFDCNVCTRDSKLYQTTAGLLLLENNTLYLLNTK